MLSSSKVALFISFCEEVTSTTPWLLLVQSHIFHGKQTLPALPHINTTSWLNYL